MCACVRACVWGASPALCCRALEPAISGEIMQLHHSKHHQTYITGLNKAAEAYAAVSTEWSRQWLAACCLL